MTEDSLGSQSQSIANNGIFDVKYKILEIKSSRNQKDGLWNR